MNRQLFAAPLVFCAMALSIPLPAQGTALPVTMAWSPVGNPGNTADPLTGYGAVAYNYGIGTYDVTNTQYVTFLDANDPTGADPLNLYNTGMSTAGLGGASYNPEAALGNKYSVIAGTGNQPVISISWYDAIRFANWMDNGQPIYNTEPTASNNATENGSYTLDGFESTPSNASNIIRNPGATIVLPSENEWYKAAYYNPAASSYYLFPTSSNTLPIGTSPTATPNSANYDFNGGEGRPTNVGAYTGTTSPYGAFDMGGDVWQWNEALLSNGVGRGARGGAFDTNTGLSALTRYNFDPTELFPDTGFRLASVPEPSTLALAALAGLSLISLPLLRR